MDYLQAIILGIVQGLTEFIPISSTAHLVFASRWTGIFGGDPQQITATMAVIQLGTIAAVFVYFATEIWNIATSFLRDHVGLLSGNRGTFESTSRLRPSWMSTDTWLGWLIIIGSIPIGTIGLLLKEQIEGPNTKNLWIISFMLIGIGLLLALAEVVSKWYERSGRGTRDVENFGLVDAVAVGFAQVLALMPGASRSGSTIMGGLFVGQKREAAARFSFLLSIPAITAAGLLQLREAWNIIPADSAMPLLVSAIVSGIVGYLAIWFLLAFLRKYSTAVFIVYRVLLGIIILVLLWQGTLDPVVNV